MSKGTVGRGFLAFAGPAEKGAFCAWMSTMIADGGGNVAVARKTGIHKDTLTKYIYGRSIPSRDTLLRLIEGGVIGYSSPEALAADTPWLDDKFIEEAKSRKMAAPKKAKMKAASNREIALAPAPPEPELIGMSLMDAIMAEKGISAKQRAQLAGLTAMIVNGVEIDIQISPRS